MVDADTRRLAVRYAPLGVLSGIWFLARFVRALLPPLFPEFQATFGVGNAETGLIYSSLLGAYALMQFPSGAVADRIWRTKVITAGTAVAGVAALGIAVAPSFPFLLLAAALFGFGTGTHKTVALTLIGEIYPDRQGGAIGAMGTIGLAGSGLAPLVIVVLGTVGFEWWAAFALSAALAVALAAANRSIVGRAAGERGEGTAAEGAEATADGGGLRDGPGARAYLEAFRRPRFAAFVLVSVLFVVTWTGVAAFLPLYLIEVKGFASNPANLLYGAMYGAALVQVGTGGLADRVGEIPVLVGGSLGMVLGLAALVALGGLPAIVVAGIVFAVAINAARPARESYLVRTIPDEVGGGTLGLVRTAMIGSGAVVSAALGVVADVAGLGTAFVGLVGVTVVTAALMLLVAVMERRAGERAA
ncbi:MAG: MFS transporter [Haloferacaceae archaeon]